VITGITEIAHITTKQDMPRWARAHADVPGIRWSVYPGPGGTMIIVEYSEDRDKASAVPDAAPVTSTVPVASTAPGPARSRALASSA